MSTSPIETGRLRHDGMYRLLATWHSAGDFDRERLYQKALSGCCHVSRAPLPGKVDAAVRVVTVLLAVHAGNDSLCADIDTTLLSTNAEKDAFGCFVSRALPSLINALHQGALAQHVGNHACELGVFCGAAVHAWMCEV